MFKSGYPKAILLSLSISAAVAGAVTAGAADRNAQTYAQMEAAAARYRDAQVRLDKGDETAAAAMNTALEDVEDLARGCMKAKRCDAAKVITVLGAVNVTAGWILWLKNMSLYPSLGDWVTSSFGLVLTIGGVLATISAFVGAIGVGMNVERAVDLGNEIASSGGPPTPEQHRGPPSIVSVPTLKTPPRRPRPLRAWR